MMNFYIITLYRKCWEFILASFCNQTSNSGLNYWTVNAGLHNYTSISSVNYVVWNIVINELCNRALLDERTSVTSMITWNHQTPKKRKNAASLLTHSMMSPHIAKYFRSLTPFILLLQYTIYQTRWRIMTESKHSDMMGRKLLLF